MTGVLLFAVSAPAALISVPLTAALGTFFAVRSVHSLRQAQLRTAQQQAERAVLGFLDEEGRHTGQLDDELLDTAYVSLRNAFMDLSAQLQANARAMVAAASRATETDSTDGSRRESLTQRRIRLDTLRRSADRALHPDGPEAARVKGHA